MLTSPPTTIRKVTTSADTRDLSLTLYNGGFGAVKETRQIGLTGTETELVFADVAQKIETDTLLVDGLAVREFDYEFDLVSRTKLLRKYIGETVVLRERKTGVEKSCRLLSVEDDGKGVLEDLATQEIYLDSQAELILPSLPAGLLVKPALIWRIEPGQVDEVQVSYLSQGFTWRANYVIELQPKTLNIAGWAEIENLSGTTFPDAQIKLIAGDVQRVEDEDDLKYKIEAPMMAMSRAMPQAEEKTFFDYHMYTLLHRTTLKDNQTKQINILNGFDVPYRKYYQLNLQEEKASVVVAFANKQENGLGVALPKGKIRLYQTDAANGSLEFVGEDQIDHTPKDEDLKLTIGQAFDITCEFRELDHRKQGGYEYHTFNCKISNHKTEAAEMHFEHFIWGNWEMIAANHPYEKKSANSVAFTIQMAADSEVNVAFEYRVDQRVEVTLKR